MQQDSKFMAQILQNMDEIVSGDQNAKARLA